MDWVLWTAGTVLGLVTACWIPYLMMTRHGMPFGLTWWAFTFPVGTCVTGTISLAVRTHSVVLHWASVGLFVLLAGAWLVVANRTAAGAWRGQLFQPAEPAG